MCCRPQKKFSNIEKMSENEENFALFTVIIMATFGIKMFLVQCQAISSAQIGTFITYLRVTNTPL